MGMPDLLDSWTRDQVLDLPEDGNRYELVDGALLVTPSPRALHQIAVWALSREVDGFVRRHGVGLTLGAPADLDLRQGQLVQPDLFVIGHGPGGRPSEWADFGVPILVVEVVSPATARYDRTIKRALYQRVGVKEYWIVDLDARLVERWRPDEDRPEILTDTLTWNPGSGSDSMVLDLKAFFKAVHEP